MYILIAAALAISLIITAAPAQKVDAATDEVGAEWTRVSTPTTEDWVLAPESYIIDYALADGGDVAYAIVYQAGNHSLLKSEDGAATWENITKGVKKEISKVLDLDSADNVTAEMMWMWRVATDGEDADFVAVALWIVDEAVDEAHVFISKDGGATFKDAGEVKDGVYFDDPDDVSDLAVSYEDADGTRDIAIGGIDNTNAAALFRCTVTAGTAGAWEDATDYDGWDNQWPSDVDTDDIYSDFVTDIIFSPSWVTDKTILVTTVDVYGTWDSDVEYAAVHLQCGSWGTTAGWNEKSTLGIEAVPILEDEYIPMWLADYFDAREIAGITLPSNYSGKNTKMRYAWVWVNYYDSSYNPVGQIFLVNDDDADLVGPKGQIEDGEVWLTNVSYEGTIAEGKAIAGVLADGVGDYADCCEGVQVYFNDNITYMDICCYGWEDACKPPTGRWAMAVSYVSADKAYAVALLGEGSYDEGAWSVSFDDGDTWNQLSLIDTYIDYLSDVAVSPNCNKTMLVSVNLGDEVNCGCDSVWLYADDLAEAPEYSDHWLRTWCGSLEGDNSADFPDFPERGLLRLAPEEVTGDTVFLVDRMSGNVYWNEEETLACWTPISSTVVDDIVDLAAQDADTLYALDATGDVAMFDDDEWQKPVDSEVGDGWTIAVWGDDIIVGGEDSDVSHSDDGGETFTALEDVATADGYVTVAFDSYFDTNSLIYAALAYAGTDNGVYRFIVGESEAWENLRAEQHDYTGLVVDRPGNPFTSAETGGVIYASYIGDRSATSTCWQGVKHWSTGVARRLYPAEEVICGECGEWDYLTVGLTSELFNMMPDALKICGCIDATTNSKLFAIDGHTYDMAKAQDGTVWTFEDCYAKHAPDLTSPVDGFVVPADPCSCYSAPFTLVWERLCDACSYDIAFALDEGFTMPVTVNGGADLTDIVIAGTIPSFSILGGAAGELSCETTYYYRVRAADAETCQIIHSWWSETRSVTIAPSVEAGIITLVSPVPGATGVGTKNVGFSWDLTAEADAFDWVLDDNADLSSPVESKNVTATACTYTGTLSYGTTYYWQVKAYNEGVPISTSAIGTFTTAVQGAFCCPQDGLCFDTQALLQAHIADAHPAQPQTPIWVWVVIAIGAVLVIVVIVLIFRTRRV
jgi:hypothetical protein